MFDIKGKIALVTGGCSGIGLCAAKGLLQNGLKAITLVDINEESGTKVLEEVKREFGEGKVIFKKADVSDKSQLEDAFKATIECFQNLDIVVNSAGIYNDREWEKSIAVNLTGTINGTILALYEYISKYKSDAEGVIVNLSSITALDTFEAIPIYSATKSAVLAFSRCVGTNFYYKINRVKVIVLCPGYTITPMITSTDLRETIIDQSVMDLAKKSLLQQTFQTPEHVADAMIQIIKEGESGSVWVIENELAPYQVSIPGREELSKI